MWLFPQHVFIALLHKQTVLSCHGIAQVDREKQINFAMDQSTLIGILIVPVLN